MTTAPTETTAEPGAVVDPFSGLKFYELSHVWGHGVPAPPGYEEPQLKRQVSHAEHGVLSHRIRTVMHTGTHVNAPHHLVQRSDGIGELALERFFGTGVILSAPKKQWELVTVADLEGTAIEPNDIVVVVTGWNRFYSDSQRYFTHAPGLSPEAARWLVERQVKLFGIDTPNVDHPLATSLGAQRGGPTAKYLPARYQTETGHDPKQDFPEWNPAHRVLLEAGIPTIENVGGDVDELVGRRVTFQAMPWRWYGGDACQIRFVAIVDPKGTYRIEPGRGEAPGEGAGTAAAGAGGAGTQNGEAR